jgi:hypothetical protein
MERSYLFSQRPEKHNHPMKGMASAALPRTVVRLHREETFVLAA